MQHSDLQCKGKVVIVTGALGLLGKAHCKALNDAGAHVVVTDLDEKQCIEFANDELEYSIGHYLDVTNKESIEKLLQFVLVNYRRVDVLVNNAAINDMFEDPKAAFEQSKFENYPLDLWQKSIQVNLTGTFLCSQVIGKQMANQKKGSIVNIASTYGVVAPDQSLYLDEQGQQTFIKPVAYPVTKAGIIMLSKYLATYWGPLGIRVNSLSPGGVQNGQEEWFIRNYARKTPLGRMANTQDYRGALVFLASDSSSYMTGSNLIVDGGWSAW